MREQCIGDHHGPYTKEITELGITGLPRIANVLPLVPLAPSKMVVPFKMAIPSKTRGVVIVSTVRSQPQDCAVFTPFPPRFAPFLPYSYPVPPANFTPFLPGG